MNDTIGQNVKAYRTARGWTQEHLAAVAGVSPRTVQRLESGEVPSSADTLAALAAAFDVTIDDLRRSAEEQAQAGFDERLKEFEQRYEIVRLDRVERASHMSSRISAADAMLLDHVPLNSDAEEDAVSAFRGALMDCIEVWNDVPANTQRECERDLQRHVEGLGALGMVVAAGTRNRRFRSQHTTLAEPFAFTLLYVMVSRASEPKTFILIDKTAPVQFT